MICKAAAISAQELTDAELRAINKQALEPLAAEQVFTFKSVLCDNEIDRSAEHFTRRALADLCALYKGKPVIKDHEHRADNQVARIYDTELVTADKKLASTGEPYTQLVARCYMVKTASNADLIAEIKGGIKREGSVGCRVKSSTCSICGTDNVQTYCRHYPGRTYDGKLCTFSLDGGADAYEFSLVAVPAQRAAGVAKSYSGTPCDLPEAPEKAATEPTPAPAQPDKTELEKLALRARILGIE